MQEQKDWAKQLQSDRTGRQRSSALRTNHIQNNSSRSERLPNDFSSSPPPTSSNKSYRRSQATRQSRDSQQNIEQSNQAEQQPNPPQEEENQEPQNKRTKNYSREVANKKRRNNKQAENQKEDKNTAGILLKVGLFFCIARDAWWLIAVILAIIPIGLTQLIALNGLVLADIICIIPFLVDKRFITFLFQDLFGVSQSKTGDIAKKGATTAAKKVGLALGEFLLLFFIFVPFYTLIFSHFIHKFENTAKSSTDLSLSSLKNKAKSFGQKGTGGSNKKNYRTSQLSKAYAKK